MKFLPFVFMILFLSCKKENAAPEVISLSVIVDFNKNYYFVDETLKLDPLAISLELDNGDYKYIKYEDFEVNGLSCSYNNNRQLQLNDSVFTVTHIETGLSLSFKFKVFERTVTDYDGNVYGIVRIGQQFWMTENLKVTHYSDGTPIPLIFDKNNNGSTNDEWSSLSVNDDAYCYYNDDRESPYGILYNWTAATGGENQLHKICPKGWHLPSEDDWRNLAYFIVNDRHTVDIDITVLKSEMGWYNNGNGTNIYGFSAFPCGYRDPGSGSFSNAGKEANWWTSSVGPDDGSSEIGVYFWYLSYNDGPLNPGGGLYGIRKSYGLSIRCIMDL